MEAEILSALQALYQKIGMLMGTGCKAEAYECLKLMKITVQDHLEKAPGDQRWILRLCLVCMHLGIVALVLEDLIEAEDELSTTMLLISGHETEPEYILITVNTLIHMGMIWLRCGHPEINRDFLITALNHYITFNDSNIMPIAYGSLFTEHNDELQSKTLKEMLYSYILLNLSEVYLLLNEKLTGAVYCHFMLKHQLKYNDYHPIDWVMSVAALAEQFISLEAFEIARHHLLAASFMLSKYKIENPHHQIFEEVKRTTADLCNFWGKYGIALLTASTNNSAESFPKGLGENTVDPHSCISQSDLENLFFPMESLDQFEDLITDQYLPTYTDARHVFVLSMKWLFEALNYYSTALNIARHCSIILEISLLFNTISMFLVDNEDHCIFQKCRAGLLEKIANDITPELHLPSHQKLWFELGDTYTNVLQHNADFVNIAQDNIPADEDSEMNTLINKIIHCFETFLNSVEEFKIELMTKVPDDIERSVISACKWLAWIHNKLSSPDLSKQIELKQNSLEYHQRIVAYSKKYDSALRLFPEIANFGDLVDLLEDQIIDLAMELIAPE